MHFLGASAHEPETVRETTNFSLEPTSGIVTLPAPPTTGTILTAGFEFDVPVRFDSDDLPVTLDIERLGSITSIPLIEVRR